MVEWTNTGPYSFFRDSIPQGILVHTWQSPSSIWAQLLIRSLVAFKSTRGLHCGPLDRASSCGHGDVGFGDHVFAPTSTWARPWFHHPPALLWSCCAAALQPLSSHSLSHLPGYGVCLVALWKHSVYCSIRGSHLRVCRAP